MSANIVLSSTGNPDHVGLETNVRRALDQARGQMDGLSAADIAYSATPADWVSPPPTNLQQAVTRLAASAGVHPVP